MLYAVLCACSCGTTTGDNALLWLVISPNTSVVASPCMLSHSPGPLACESTGFGSTIIVDHITHSGHFAYKIMGVKIYREHLDSRLEGKQRNGEIDPDNQEGIGAAAQGW